MRVAAPSPPPVADSGYQRGWLRMIPDHEIPAFDDRFLSKYDPPALAEVYASTGLSSYMFFCKQMNGWCFWPTKVGEMHPGLRGHDIVEETAALLAERGIAACAYYCAIYDNWAFHRYPDWRFQPVGGRRRTGTASDRYGTCCPNSPGYRQYIMDQIADLFGRYDFESGFCDMSFWPGVCGCRHCVQRYKAEVGEEIPEIIDWTSPDWCSFQSARERWIDEFQGAVTGAMREARPGIAVYHNFAPGPVHWAQGVPFSVTEHSDFLGGDLYGDDIEQLLVTRLMRNLSRSAPVEFMTSTTADIYQHVQLKRPEQLRAQTLGAVAESAAFTLIDAIDPVGTVNPAQYEQVRIAFEAGAKFQPYLGGQAIEDVAVYFSGASRVDFAENGRPLSDGLDFFADYPHLQAVRGACRLLDRAHIPFGVITERQLAGLDDYRVLVLPNVLRLDAREADAIREYVRRGGRLYASKYTSLVETRGVRHDDFMLADVFGVQVDREEAAAGVHLRPVTAEVQTWLYPQRYLSGNPARGSLDGGLLRIRAQAEGHVLAALSLTYGHPHMGDLFDENWSWICSLPPWDDTDEPGIVAREFGAGRAVYSVIDIETDDFDANERLFARLISDLLGDDWTLQCEANRSVSISAFHHPEDNAIRVALLNAPAVVSEGTAVRLRSPGGSEFVGLEEVPSGSSIPFATDVDGAMEFTMGQLPELTMLIARYR